MILTQTKGPEDWKQLLAMPNLHWKPEYSAHALAHCWEAAKARGFPTEVGKALEPINAELLLAIPEYKVSLPGGTAASQNDIFCLARNHFVLS
jgi:hypothetical protein